MAPTNSPTRAADLIEPETMVGMLKKAARVIERAAKHPEYGSQALWEISAAIKEEAKRILDDTHRGGKPPVMRVRCPGEAHSNAYIDNCEVCLPYWGVIPVCPREPRGHGKLPPSGWCGGCRRYYDAQVNTTVLEALP